MSILICISVVIYNSRLFDNLSVINMLDINLLWNLHCCKCTVHGINMMKNEKNNGYRPADSYDCKNARYYRTGDGEWIGLEAMIRMRVSNSKDTYTAIGLKNVIRTVTVPCRAP